MKTIMCFALASLALLASGCDYNGKSIRRLQLPRGDAEKGKAAFIALNCTACHTVEGVELPKPTAAPESIIALGGEVASLRSYGDLLTSIIHPNAGISEKMKPAKGSEKSPMPVTNDVMTVAQMVDLVTFLQPHYRQLPPPIEWYYPL